jgi:uncharacterized protein YjbI with pentapeptide repeats
MKRLSTIILVSAVLVLGYATMVQADIYQWAWSPTLGTYSTFTLCPGGTGVTGTPGADLSSRNLTQAYLIGANLTSVSCYGSTLTNAALNYANLTNANFYGGTFTNANFTGATVKGGAFRSTTGFTAQQLYSTASYQAKDLEGTQFGGGTTDLTGWNFTGQNLTNAGFGDGTLTSANLTNANLTNVGFYGATLTNANFTGATVKGAYLGYTTGFTAQQLYSTASYQAKDLEGIRFRDNNLTGWNFAGQNLNGAWYEGATMTGVNLTNANLTNAQFYNASLTGANLTNANLTDAWVGGGNFGSATGFTAQQLYSTASYKAKDLEHIGLSYNNLTGWNFAGQNLGFANLTNANLTNANLTNAYLDNATVKGADFDYTNITAQQLYSTASYQAKDLTGIGLGSNNLTGGNFAGQNLTKANFTNANLTNAYLGGAEFTDAIVKGANFSSTVSKGFTAQQLYSTASYKANYLAGIGLGYNNLTAWNFTGQNLTNAILSSATLTNANLTCADLRGAQGFNSAGAILSNTILPDGTINGLDLNVTTLIVRNYAGNSNGQPIPIHIKEGMTHTDGAALDIVLDNQNWGSTISFDAGIPVDLGRILELELADGVDPHMWRTWKLFDWTGVSPEGTFYVWTGGLPFDLSNLYTSGDVTLLPEPATLSLLAIGAGVLLRRRRSVR